MLTVFTAVDYTGYYGPVMLFALTFYCLLKRLPYLIAFTAGSIFNTFSNEILKQIFREPRPSNQLPFIDDADLTGVHHYGMPSAHAQAAAYSLAFLALANGPPAFLYFMAAIFVITLYQRWKYNRHTIQQLAAGSAAGVVVAWGVFYITQYYIHQYKHRWIIL